MRAFILSAVVLVAASAASAETKFWIAPDNSLLRATDGSYKKFPGAVAVTTIPPEHGRQVWNGSGWVDSAPVLIPKLRAAFRKEGLSRIAAQVPEWSDPAAIKVVIPIWGSILNPTPAQVAAKSIYDWVEGTAIPKLNAMTDPAAIKAIDVTSNDPFGDGTTWP